MPELSIIIVNFNVKEHLANCITSILDASKKVNTEIIVVDNNSFDGSVEFIQKKFPHLENLKIIENESNFGFAKANNIGVRQASGDYLLILNPDTILQEDTLTKCLDYYKQNPLAGALTCKLVLPNGKLDLACRRSFPSASVAIYRMIGLSRLFPKSRKFARYNLTYLDENETYEVDAIVGAFMFISRRIFEQVGGFDEDYFMYGEDIDLCFRIKNAGYKNYYYSGTSIIHYKGESTRKSSVSYVNNFYGAMKIFAEKNLKQSSWILNFLIRISISYRSFFSYLKRFIANTYPAILDLILIIVAQLASIYLRFEYFPLEAYTVPIIVYTIIWLTALTFVGSYKQTNRFSLMKPFSAILIGFFVNSAFTYYFKEYAFSRVVVLRSAAYIFALLGLWRLIVKIKEYSSQKNLIYKAYNTLVVGKNTDTEKFLTKHKHRPDSYHYFIGYISANPKHSDEYIGNLNNIGDVVKAYKVKEIIFAKNVLTNQQVIDTMWNLKNFNLNYKILSGDSDLILGKSQLDRIGNIYLMQIEYNINKKINIFVKRCFDLIFGLICLVSLFPAAFLYSKLANSRESSHKFHKKLLLIPQVINGKYSFVGRATWDTTSAGKQYLGKHGLTGLVQINYYRELSSDDIEYFNYYYAKNQSFWFDLEILLKTLSLFIFRKKINKL
jgi:hypothetical protein